MSDFTNKSTAEIVRELSSKVEAIPDDNVTVSQDYDTSSDASDSTSDAIPGGNSGEATSEERLRTEDGHTDPSFSRTAPKNSQSTASDPNVDWLTVKDHKGRSLKVKVDYSDKDSIKKAFGLAAGARKWQTERDDLKKELENFRGSNKDKIEKWDLISKTYDEQGIQGLINFLEGEGGTDKLVQQLIQEKEWRSTALPEEVALKESQLREARTNKEYEKLQKEIEKLRQETSQSREQSELNELKSQFYPVFDKYRFAGKLNNPANEHLFDKMLWNTAIEALENYPDEVEITPQMVTKEFQKVSNSIRSVINQQAVSQSTKIVENKKRSATEEAQSKVLNGIKRTNTGIEVSKAIGDRQGFKDLFKSMATRNKNFFSS